MFTSDRNSGAQRSFEFLETARLATSRMSDCSLWGNTRIAAADVKRFRNAEKGFISTTPRAATALSYSVCRGRPMADLALVYGLQSPSSRCTTITDSISLQRAASLRANKSGNRIWFHARKTAQSLERQCINSLLEPGVILKTSRLEAAQPGHPILSIRTPVCSMCPVGIPPPIRRESPARRQSIHQLRRCA